MSRHAVVLPDLGMDDQPITLSLWLIRRGGRVMQGEPVVEVLAGAATVDLPAPADGILRTLVAENEPITTGQTLGVIETDEQ